MGELTRDGRFLTCFDFHGIRIELGPIGFGEGSVPEPVAVALAQLREDFAYFALPPNSEGRAAQASAPRVRVRLGMLATRSRSKPFRSQPRAFRTRMCSAYGWSGTRICDYGEWGWSRSSRASRCREIEVRAPSAESLYEIAYSALLSSVGEELDLRGFHRVHALGFRRGSRSAILLLPQGGGKSALAALLMAEDGVRIFSDEIPLLRAGKLYPFPLRVALHEEVARAVGWERKQGRPFKRKVFPTKLLYPIPKPVTAEPERVSLVLVGRPARGMPRIVPARKASVALGLLAPMVVGLGVPQMAEYMLRGETLLPIVRIGVSRLAGALRLARQADAAVFEFGKDALLNARVLQEYLDSREGFTGAGP